ncbi:Type I restriction-modification system, specificity subunit S [Salmonella enterica subsp. enterica serovar Cubana]|nr:Type I restriction-modification system, specificity subunit S [Salmonella enterica subsp. enterica serovar Cubana]
MSYLEKLLNEAKFEWKNLSDVARIKNGKDHKSLGEGKFPVYGSGGIMRYADNYAYNKSSVLIPRKGSLGNLFFVDVPFWTVDTIFYTEIDEAQIRPKYLYYFLTTVGLGDMNQAGGVPSQTQSVLNKLKIPVPCPDNPEKSLAIQSEIVRILDKFTALTAELTAELNIRKKQYNYYRDKLLSFEEDEVEWKTLEEVSTFANGKGHEKDISKDGKYIVVNSKFISTDGEVAKFSNKQLCPLFKDDILLVMSDLPNGKALSKTFIIDEDHKYTLNQRIGGITVKNSNELLPKFLHYFLNRTPQLLKHDNGVDQTNLRKGQILEVKVPMISLIKQVQIVEILDKFDTYTKSISEGLPREIELRQKQYEYYRDLLFSFPKPDTVNQ